MPTDATLDHLVLHVLHHNLPIFSTDRHVNCLQVFAISNHSTTNILIYIYIYIGTLFFFNGSVLDIPTILVSIYIQLYIGFNIQHSGSTVIDVIKSSPPPSVVN